MHAHAAEPSEPIGGTDDGTGGTDDGTGGPRRYSVPQAARRLGISERAVRKRIDAGTVLAVRDGRTWTVILEEPNGGTDTAGSAVLAAPSEPGAAPRRSSAEPGTAGTASIDLSPLVALVDSLTRRNAELTEAATIWQFRAGQLEERLKQLTAGGPGAGDAAPDRGQDAPGGVETASDAPRLRPASWLRRLLGWGPS